MQVEICINADTRVKQSVTAAYLGGADTIELCGQMAMDGLTPLAEHIAIAREAFADRPGLMVMVRPRGGDFCYSRSEIEEMLWGVETAVSHKADGVVFGAIQNNSLDLKIMHHLTDIARKHALKVTCHRAFDATTKPAEALDMLIDLGVSRVLTSGAPWGSNLSVSTSIPQLTRLIQQADNRIEIVLGGGINLENIRGILAQLPATARLSAHTYSGVLRNGVTDLTAVQKMVGIVNGVG